MVATRSGGKSPKKEEKPKKTTPAKRPAAEDNSGKTPAKKTMTETIAIGKPANKDVTLVNQESKEVKFSDLYKDQGVVIFMYPRANTPGCTKQACGFRDHAAEIKAAGFHVYGLSGDSPKSLTNWKTKEKLSYDLLSDPKHELIKYFGSSIGGSKVQRSHVIILKGGVVGDIQPKVSPAESVDRAVEFVKKNGASVSPASPTNKSKPAAATSPSPTNKTKPASPTKKAEAKEALEVGKKTSFDVELKTHASESVRFQALFKEKGVVFFMFPKADTPGCTVQACGFNDHIDEIRACGFDVFGLSGDAPQELSDWKKKKEYAYDFLSDPKHELIKYFGSSLENGRVDRSHVIILPGGEVGEVKHKISPKDSFTGALAFVMAHKK